MGTEIRGLGPYTVHGYELEGSYEFEPEERGTYDTPEYGPVVTITNVYIDGSSSNAVDLIDPSVTQYLERRILNELPDGTDADYDEGPAFDEWRFDREAA